MSGDTTPPADQEKHQRLIVSVYDDKRVPVPTSFVGRWLVAPSDEPFAVAETSKGRFVGLIGYEVDTDKTSEPKRNRESADDPFEKLEHYETLADLRAAEAIPSAVKARVLQALDYVEELDV